MLDKEESGVNGPPLDGAATGVAALAAFWRAARLRMAKHMADKIERALIESMRPVKRVEGPWNGDRFSRSEALVIEYPMWTKSVEIWRGPTSRRNYSRKASRSSRWDCRLVSRLEATRESGIMTRREEG